MVKNGSLAATIIKPGHVLAPQGLKEGWGARIEEGRIACVRPWDSLGGGSNEEAQTVCLPGQMLLPSFVNGHNHMYGVLSHGTTAEVMVADFFDYLKDFWWPCVEDKVDHDLTCIAARRARVEMIDSGVTPFVDIPEGPNSIPGALEVEKEEVEKAGPRGYLSFEAYKRKSRENGVLGLKENFDFAKACNEEKGLMKGVMSIHTLFIRGEDFIREAKWMADEAGCLLHMYMSESNLKPAWAREHLGIAPTEAHDGMGCLDGNVLTSQLAQVIDKEIATLAGKGVKGISMPLSNCEVGGGIAPIEKVLEAGMTAGLGTDSYVNNFFEVMRGAFLTHKSCHRDPRAMPARKVHRTATELGAEAVGIEAGAIKEGILADLITVDVARPTPINEYNVYDQLVLLTNPQNVISVMVGGAWLKRGGKPVTLDKEAVRREMEEKTERFWKGDSECC